MPVMLQQSQRHECTTFLVREVRAIVPA